MAVCVPLQGVITAESESQLHELEGGEGSPRGVLSVPVSRVCGGPSQRVSPYLLSPGGTFPTMFKTDAAEAAAFSWVLENPRLVPGG